MLQLGRPGLHARKDAQSRRIGRPKVDNRQMRVATTTDRSGPFGHHLTGRSLGTDGNLDIAGLRGYAHFGDDWFATGRGLLEGERQRPGLEPRLAKGLQEDRWVLVHVDRAGDGSAPEPEALRHRVVVDAARDP